MAERLAANIDYLRVDFYIVADEIYFGELTPYEGSGFGWAYRGDPQFENYPPRDFDFRFGELWQQPPMSV